MTTFCRATINYVSGASPEMRPLPVEVDINDGRSAAPGRWDECGFELVPHRSAVRDWTDDDEIAAVHYPEAEEVARRLTGSDYALVSDHVKRRAGDARNQREQTPVGLVHSDFAAGYDDIVRMAYRDVRGRGAATLARSGLTPAEIEQAPRIVMLQLWRNLGPSKMDLPVCFCDN